MPDVTVVLPSNRPADCAEFIAAWEPQLRDGATVIVMEDGPHRTMDVPGWVHHVSHAEAAQDLGDNSWIIPQRSSACRSYGTLVALKLGADIIWHLDDDCRPEPGVSYLDRLTRILSAERDDPRWFNTLRDSLIYPRGYPYGIRNSQWPVMIHHGLWSHVPDLDGRTQLEMPHYRLKPATDVDDVPPGAMFPMCGMNLAFRRDAATLMYMGLQGGHLAADGWWGGYPFDRFDDMWAGLFAKRICDHLGWAVTSGAPSIRHDRASDPERNARIEAPGIAAHEQLWPLIAEFDLTGKTAAECYDEMRLPVTRFGIGRREAAYWHRLSAAMGIWADLTG